MFVTNAEALSIASRTVLERTEEEEAKLAAWMSVEPEYDAVDFYRD